MNISDAYVCDQCGKTFNWDKSVNISWLVALGRGWKSWDHEFHLCSNKCFNAIARRDKKDLVEMSAKKIFK